MLREGKLMFQTCQKCSHESPTGDRYCRQCGEPFIVETGASGAATRNYVKQESMPVANAGSGYFPPSVADAIVGDTERYYQSHYQPPQMPVPPAQFTSQSRKKFWRWRGFFWLFSLFLSALVGSMLTIPIMLEEARPRPPDPPPSVLAEREAYERQQRQKHELQQKIREAGERADEARDRSKEAYERFKEAYDQALEAGAKAATNSSEKAIDLSEYEYPGARISSANRIPGYEMLTIRTSDDIETIKQFYQKRIGPPVIEINESYEKWLLFQAVKGPSMIVYVNSEFDDGIRIVVLRYPFRIVPLEDTQTQK
jgi:hypothetical protein